MNILVTVGTTRFDALIAAVDQHAAMHPEFGYVYQCADGQFCPRRGERIDFVSNIDEFYLVADLVITHAGAGSIYKLLEMNKRILIVPNLERIDKHQSDIAEFMAVNNHAMVCHELDSLSIMIDQALAFTPTPFIKTPFFKANEIAGFILGL